MIILPDRNISRSRFLMAVPHREWMPPSRSQQKTFCGDEDRTRFRLRAKTHDGYVVWTGWFEDRNDADAFLFALVSGSLIYERELWRLPTPEWHPGVSPDLFYNFVTQTILTTTGSNQTYTSPSDWTNSNNLIECLGGGAGGASRLRSVAHQTGGGGGAFSAITNFVFATPGVTTATYNVGAGGIGPTITTATSASGGNGSATWFNDTVNPGNGTTNAKCSAAAGVGGVSGTGSRNGGAGGASTSSWGQTKFSGGRGGNLTGASGLGSSGGGGAAGPSGAGGNGVDSTSTATIQTAGGSSNNGTLSGGGAGGFSGSSGTEFSASFGCGSGGGGRASTSGLVDNAAGGNGGNYGAGGGASALSDTGALSSDGGDGRQGLIIIEYTPPSTNSLANNNLPMLGM